MDRNRIFPYDALDSPRQGRNTLRNPRRWGERKRQRKRDKLRPPETRKNRVQPADAVSAAQPVGKRSPKEEEIQVPGAVDIQDGNEVEVKQPSNYLFGLLPSIPENIRKWRGWRTMKHKRVRDFVDPKEKEVWSPRDRTYKKRPSGLDYQSRGKQYYHPLDNSDNSDSLGNIESSEINPDIFPDPVEENGPPQVFPSYDHAVDASRSRRPKNKILRRIFPRRRRQLKLDVSSMEKAPSLSSVKEDSPISSLDSGSSVGGDLDESFLKDGSPPLQRMVSETPSEREEMQRRMRELYPGTKAYHERMAENVRMTAMNRDKNFYYKKVLPEFYALEDEREREEQQRIAREKQGTQKVNDFFIREANRHPTIPSPRTSGFRNFTSRVANVGRRLFTRKNAPSKYAQVRQTDNVKHKYLLPANHVSPDFSFHVDSMDNNDSLASDFSSHESIYKNPDPSLASDQVDEDYYENPEKETVENKQRLFQQAWNQRKSRIQDVRNADAQAQQRREERNAEKLRKMEERQKAAVARDEKEKLHAEITERNAQRENREGMWWAEKESRQVNKYLWDIERKREQIKVRQAARIARKFEQENMGKADQESTLVERPDYVTSLLARMGPEELQKLNQSYLTLEEKEKRFQYRLGIHEDKKREWSNAFPKYFHPKMLEENKPSRNDIAGFYFDPTSKKVVMIEKYDFVEPVINYIVYGDTEVNDMPAVTLEQQRDIGQVLITKAGFYLENFMNKHGIQMHELEPYYFLLKNNLLAILHILITYMDDRDHQNDSMYHFRSKEENDIIRECVSIIDDRIDISKTYAKANTEYLEADKDVKVYSEVLEKLEKNVESKVERMHRKGGRLTMLESNDLQNAIAQKTEMEEKVANLHAKREAAINTMNLEKQKKDSIGDLGRRFDFLQNRLMEIERAKGAKVAENIEYFYNVAMDNKISRAIMHILLFLSSKVLYETPPSVTLYDIPTFLRKFGALYQSILPSKSKFVKTLDEEKAERDRQKKNTEAEGFVPAKTKKVAKAMAELLSKSTAAATATATAEKQEKEYMAAPFWRMKSSLDKETFVIDIAEDAMIPVDYTPLLPVEYYSACLYNQNNLDIHTIVYTLKNMYLDYEEERKMSNDVQTLSGKEAIGRETAIIRKKTALFENTALFKYLKIGKYNVREMAKLASLMILQAMRENRLPRIHPEELFYLFILFLYNYYTNLWEMNRPLWDLAQSYMPEDEKEKYAFQHRKKPFLLKTFSEIMITLLLCMFYQDEVEVFGNNRERVERFPGEKGTKEKILDHQKFYFINKVLAHFREYIPPHILYNYEARKNSLDLEIYFEHPHEKDIDFIPSKTTRQKQALP